MFKSETEHFEMSTLAKISDDHFYRTLVENSLEGIWVIDTQGMTTFVNKSMAEMLGYTIDEMMGKSFYDFMDAEATSHAAKNLQKRRDGISEQHSFTFRHRNGSSIWTIIATNPMLDEQGRITGAFAFVSDLTKLWLTNRALEESEKKYRALHESLMDGFVLVDMDGRIREFNESYRQILGYDKEELLQLTNVDITPDRWRLFEEEIVRGQILLKGYSDVYEKEYFDKEGTLVPVELRTFLIRDEAGMPKGMWAIVRDIRIRKSTEEELRRREKDYRELMELAADAIIVADSAGKITAVNAKTLSLFGYERAALASMHVQQLLELKDDFSSDKQTIANQVLESKSHKKNGDTVFLESNVSNLADNKLQFIVRDVSARKCEEEEFLSAVESGVYERLFVMLRLFTHGGNGLDNLNRLNLLSEGLSSGSAMQALMVDRYKSAVEEFFAVTFSEIMSIVSLIRVIGKRESHSIEVNHTLDRSGKLQYHANELRQSIATVLSYSHGNSSTKFHQAQQNIKEHVAAIKQNTKEMYAAILNNYTTDVSTAIALLLEKYRMGLMGTELCFEDKLHGEKAIIRKAELCIVVSTLIENAIEELSLQEGSTKAKKILVRAYAEPSKILIIVQDNGHGVDEKLQSSLFEYGTSSKGNGRGFGLSHVKACLQKYGSTVEYHAVHDGGSCFTISLFRV